MPIFSSNITAEKVNYRHTLGLYMVLALLASTSLSTAAVAVEGYHIDDGQEPASISGRYTNLDTGRVPAKPLSTTTSYASGQQNLTAAAPLSARKETALTDNNSLDTGQTESLARTAAPAAQVGYIQPISNVALPEKPLYPSRIQNANLPTVNALNAAVSAAPVTPDDSPSNPDVVAQPPKTPLSAPQEKTVAATEQPVLSPPPSVIAITPDQPIASAKPLALPPVSDAVKAKAEQELAREAAQKNEIAALPATKYINQQSAQTNPPARSATRFESDASASNGHIALPPPPAPLLARTENARISANNAAPVSVTAPPEVLGSIAPNASASVTRTALSEDSRQILGKLQPAHIVLPATKAARVDVKRVSPDVANIVKKATQVYESAGVSLKVRPTQSDPSIELSHAYDALMKGDNAGAIQIYQSILHNNPTNEDALFGLAATYHRSGQLENARSLYGRLLTQNPSHREGLNNFLVLAANEAPEETLQALSSLELRNPDFSPIPAQMALILDRLGRSEEARNKMIRAIQLAPENWAYKYNLAIMLDREGYYADAAQLYKDLISASLQGEKIPGNTRSLQERLNYIATRKDYYSAS